MSETGSHAVEVLKKLDVTKPAPAEVPVATYDRVLDMAINQGAPLEQLEKWMELKERHEKAEAKKAYHKAMAAFKADPPEIYKDKRVGFHAKGSKTEYSHASLHNVSSLINKALSKQGLSAAYNTMQGESGIQVVCTITHELGHSESTSLTAGADNTGNKNSIQAIGSTISYLERYTILALTGLATKDMDDDGVASEAVEYIAGKDLVDLKKKYGEGDDDKFFQFAEATSWNDIPKRNENKLHSMLNDRNTALAKKKAAKKPAPQREPGQEG